MKIIPAIDIYNGKAVRLYKGDYEKSTIYGNPIDIAKKWEKEGASLIHLVDLNGAKEGSLSNFELVKSIVASVNIPCELGGGIRRIENISAYLEAGISRVIIGSKALDLDFLALCLNKFGKDKIVVGIDSQNLIIKTNGWLNDSKLNAITYGKMLKTLGLKTVIFTDISKDGTLEGISIDQTKQMVLETGLDIIASGGANTLNDISNAMLIGCSGIILGKSLYQGTINLKDAINKYEV